MKTEMTERDKKLLIFLAIFVVVVGVSYWGIRPLIRSIKTINNSITQQEELKTENDYKISMIPLLSADEVRMNESLAESRVGFFDMMSSDEIDKYITGVMLDHGLYCYDLNFTIADEDSTLGAYAYSQKALNSYSGSDEYYGEFDDYGVTTGIRSVSVSMRVGGTPEQIRTLIDDLSVSSQKLLLEAYSWSTEQRVVYNDDGTYDIEESRTLTINLILFMLTSEEE